MTPRQSFFVFFGGMVGTLWTICVDVDEMGIWVVDFFVGWEDCVVDLTEAEEGFWTEEGAVSVGFAAGFAEGVVWGDGEDVEGVMGDGHLEGRGGGGIGFDFENAVRASHAAFSSRRLSDG